MHALRRRLSAPTAVFWGLVLVFGAWMTHRYRTEWFLVADDWTMLGSRVEHWRLFGFDDFLLRRHNEHLMGGMTLWNWALAEIFGLRNYTPWVITVQIGNAFVSWVTYRFMKRLDVPAVAAASMAPLLMIWGPFITVAYWAPEAIFTICLALVMLHFWLVSSDTNSVRRDIAGAGASILAIFIHSVCAAVLPVLLASLMVRRRWKSLAISSIPLALYGLWYATYQRRQPSNRWLDNVEEEVWQDRSLGLFVTFTWKTLSRVVWPHSSLTAAMVLVAFVTAGAVVCFRRGGQQRLMMIAAIAAASIYMFGFTWSRGYVTVEVFQEDPPSRYAAVVGLLLIPIAAVPIGVLFRRVSDMLRAVRPAGVTVGVLALMLVIAVNARQRADSDPNMMPGAYLFRARVLGVASDPALPTYPPDEFVFGELWTADLVFDDILHFKRNGWL